MAAKPQIQPQRFLSSNDLPGVLKALNSISPHNVINFGLDVGISCKTFEIQYHQNMGACLREILSERLKQEPPLTWLDIVTALRSPSVNEDQLAGQIECHFPCSVPQQEETERTLCVPTFQFSPLSQPRVLCAFSRPIPLLPVNQLLSTPPKSDEPCDSRQPVVPLPSSAYPGSADNLSGYCGYDAVNQGQISRVVENTIRKHYSNLTKVFGDNLPYFSTKFVELGFVSRDSVDNISTMLGIGDQERGRRLLSSITTNLGTSRDAKTWFKSFVRVLSRPAYQELATSMSETYEFSNKSVSRTFQPSFSAVEMFINHVKTCYRLKSVERDTAVVKWPHTPSEVYINLALMDRQCNSAKSKEYAKVTKAMICDGNVDIVLKDAKGSIEFGEIAKSISESEPNERRLILVEGAPGVGKSTFSWEFCRKWEKKEIAQQFDLVLLLRLRDEGIRKAKSLKDLITHPLEDVAQVICYELLTSCNFNALIILEGFDELPDNCRNNDQSIFMQLVSGKLLPLTTVLVTSRPWATQVIHQNCENRILQHIEILGFTSDQITEYLESTLSPIEVSDLSAYLERHPQIRSGMYIPLNSAIVVRVYQEHQMEQSTLPTTLTELYTDISKTLLQRHMRGHPEHSPPEYNRDTTCTAIFQDLSAPVHENLSKLCKLAYRSIVSTSDQVQLIFRDLPSDFDDLGFMDSVTELYVTRGTVSSYNFLHLTFQEYLAAVHISTMSEDKQLNHFQRHEEGRLKMVLRFLAGLKRLSCVSNKHLDHFLQNPSEHRSDSSYLMYCDVAVNIDLVNWMFEAQSDDVMVEKTIEFNYVNKFMLPLDYYSLGYCIVHNQSQWVLGLQWNEIDKEKAKMLASGASTRRETSGRVVELRKLGEISTTCLNNIFIEWKSILYLHQLSLKLPEPYNRVVWPDLTMLRVLQLEISGKTNWRFDVLLPHLSLESLTISICDENFLRREDCMAIGDHITSTFTSKELLILSHKEDNIICIDDEGGIEIFTAALARLPLERLEWKYSCVFTDTAAENLAEFITNSTTLQHITILHCAFSVHGLLAVTRAIQCSSTLQSKYIVYMKTLRFTVKGDDELNDLAQLLFDIAKRSLKWSVATSDTVIAGVPHHNSTLCELNLSYCNSSIKGVIALAKALHDDSTVEWLNLSHGDISDGGAVELAQALHHNTTLKWLQLNDNKVSGAGAVALAQALHCNSTLKFLDLFNNSINDDGAAALARALHDNSTLLWLDLSGNDGIGSMGTSQLVLALAANTQCKLLLSERCKQYAEQCDQYWKTKRRIVIDRPLPRK